MRGLPDIRLVEVDSSNWRQAVDVRPQPEQEAWVAPVARYLCLAHFEGDWHSLGIEFEGSIVGHVMWAVDPVDDSTWLGGLVVDAGFQGRGIGRAAVLECLELFEKGGVVNAALSFSPDNEVARRLYADLGFVETGEMEGDEIVARFVRGV